MNVNASVIIIYEWFRKNANTLSEITIQDLYTNVSLNTRMLFHMSKHLFEVLKK